MRPQRPEGGQAPMETTGQASTGHTGEFPPRGWDETAARPAAEGTTAMAGPAAAQATTAQTMVATELTPEAAMMAQASATAAIAASTVAFLAGVWLAMAPLAFDYRGAGGGFESYWNEIIIGAAVALVALVQVTRPVTTAVFSVASVVMGIWLIISPFAQGYNDSTAATGAVWNNILVGLIVIIAGAMSAAMGMRSAQELR